MRLDAPEASRRSQTPSQVFPNGSSAVSPSRRAGLAKAAANGSSHAQPESNGSSLIGFQNGNSRPALWFGHDREEVTRILIQSLMDLGYHGAAEALVQESGFELEGPTVAAFRGAVLQGTWAEAEAILLGTAMQDDGGGVGLGGGEGSYGSHLGKSSRVSWPPPTGRGRGLTLSEGANKAEMLFSMRQQKYLELLEKGEKHKALMVLRQELTPLHQDTARLHALSSLMMCDTETLKAQAQWDGAAGQSRHHLLSQLSRSISPTIMIPEQRLAVLLDQVKEAWIAKCLYHNTSENPSLFVDHTCDRSQVPLQTVLELRQHSDEVWYLRFSHDGTKLATTSADHTIVIYDTSNYRPIHILQGHDSGVCFVAWSPDDTKIITCAQVPDNSARIWDVKSGDCLRVLSEFTYPVTTATWAPNGESFIIGSQDSKHALCVYNRNYQLIYLWEEEGLRVHDLAISPDGERLVVLLEQRIFVYDFSTREKLCEWAIEDVKLTSISISRDSRHMLVSMNENKIRLMDMETGEVLTHFTGQKQTQFIIRSAFGGADESFVASGSEDSYIYIWRTNGHLVERLEAHKPGCVNAVAWHPTDPHVFASAGDDHKVRIWATSRATNPSPIFPGPNTSSTNGFSRR